MNMKLGHPHMCEPLDMQFGSLQTLKNGILWGEGLKKYKLVDSWS